MGVQEVTVTGAADVVLFGTKVRVQAFMPSFHAYNVENELETSLVTHS